FSAFNASAPPSAAIAALTRSPGLSCADAKWIGVVLASNAAVMPKRYFIVLFLELSEGIRRLAQSVRKNCDADASGTQVESQLGEVFCLPTALRCQMEGPETSVRRRFVGSSRTSYCLPSSRHMGCRTLTTIEG